MEQIKTKKHQLAVAIALAGFVSLPSVASEPTQHTENYGSNGEPI